MVSKPMGGRNAWSVGDAKEHFDQMIRLVEQGQTASIVRDGQVVAELKPSPSGAMTAEERRVAVERFLEERARWGPINVTLEEMMAWRHDGHRW